jgi:glyoxylase-like metal-dependent hydrolase (beta-lactamase superfamily II)
MSDIDIKEVGKKVYAIDDRLYSIPGAGTVYFLAEDRKALIDTGPATSAAAVLEGIKALGIKSEEVEYILITHIHLDHSGGVGTILKNMPRAMVVAHHRAIKHLLDPAKLIVSAGEAQGKETIGRNGEILPVDSGRVIPAREGDIIRLSDEQVLTLMETPGHAPHELCIRESRNNGVFVGDAVGHFIEGIKIMVPVTPPPSFDLEQYLQTLDRLAQLKLSSVYFAHSGTSEKVQELLQAARGKLLDRERIIAGAAADNRLDSAAELLVNHICSELGLLKQEMRAVYDDWAGNDIPMSAAEHVRYFRRKHGLL